MVVALARRACGIAGRGASWSKELGAHVAPDDPSRSPGPSRLRVSPQSVFLPARDLASRSHAPHRPHSIFRSRSGRATRGRSHAFGHKCLCRKRKPSHKNGVLRQPAWGTIPRDAVRFNRQSFGDALWARHDTGRYSPRQRIADQEKSACSSP